MAYTILILTNKWDLSADFVVKKLTEEAHPFLRLNTEDLRLGKATVWLPEGKIIVSKDGKERDLSEIRAVWNRRPGKPYDDVPRAERPGQAIQRFVNDQWYAWLEALQTLPATWVNHPRNNDRAESKIWQLKLASQLGFPIPFTVVSNDPDALRKAAVQGKGLIAKALYSPLIEEEDKDSFIFTNKLDELPEDATDEIRLSPLIAQQPLIPKIDYRVTVVGTEVFAAKVAYSGKVVDWRLEKEDVRFIRHELPVDVRARCLRFVQEADLKFGAIDLVEHEGQFYFLEVNPNGEWGWLQKPWGFPIAEALVNLLCSLDREAR